MDYYCYLGIDGVEKWPVLQETLTKCFMFQLSLAETCLNVQTKTNWDTVDKKHVEYIVLLSRSQPLFYRCLPLMRLFCKNNETVTSLTCTVVCVFIPCDLRVTHWPCIWSSSVSTCVAGIAHPPHSSYMSLRLHVRCVCVFFSGSVPGMRPAEAGEFTRRAFQAGKMGLTEVFKRSLKKAHRHLNTINFNSDGHNLTWISGSGNANSQ